MVFNRREVVFEAANVAETDRERERFRSSVNRSEVGPSCLAVVKGAPLSGAILTQSQRHRFSVLP